MTEKLELELETMSTVLTALGKLDSQETQTRVLKWVAEKLSLNVGVGAPGTAKTPSSAETDTSSGHPAVAAAWQKQNGLTNSEIDVVFHVGADGIDVIAPDIPGKSNREKTLNSYVLAGAREFLRTGDGAFSDKAARELCTQFGCFDTTNHAKYIHDKGNEFAGSKDKGWTLTGPGKKRAASLIKEIAAKLLQE